jgi:hypothetical protein
VVLLDPQIHQGIARAAVETQERQVRISRNQGDIRNAADIHHGEIPFTIPKHALMKTRHQRRTLSTGSHVFRPEIRDGQDAGAVGNDAGIRDLERVGAGPVHRVTNCLSVAANGGNGADGRIRVG